MVIDREERKHRIRVGILVALGLVLLIFGYSWLNEFRIRKEKHYYRIKFKEVGWINKGDVVTILGVPKGRVKDIELFPDSVIVIVWIDGCRLREGATAWLESLGIIGQMRLGIKLGRGEPLPDWSTIPGIAKEDLGDVISRLAEFLRRSDSLLVGGLRLMGEAEEEIGGASSRLDRTLENINMLVDDLRQVLMEKSADLDTSKEKLDVVVTKLDSIETLILEGRGTLSKLLKEDDLYYRADSTLRSLEELLLDIRQNPRRYITVKIF